MTKTFEELKEIDSIVARLYGKKPDYKNGRFGYAYSRFYKKNFEPIQKEYNQELVDIRIDNALEDKTTKEILKDNNPNSRGFLYSKEGLKQVIKLENTMEEKFFTKEIEIDPYFVKTEDIPVEFTEMELELLKGLIIE